VLIVRATTGGGVTTETIPWVEITELPCWLLADRREVLFHAVKIALSSDASPAVRAANATLVQRNARFFTAAEYSKIVATQSEMERRSREEEKRISQLRRQGYIEFQGQWVKPTEIRQQGFGVSQGHWTKTPEDEQPEKPARAVNQTNPLLPDQTDDSQTGALDSKPAGIR